MKKITLILLTLFVSLGLFFSNSFAYTTINPDTALEMYTNNDDLIVVDVREKELEYCFGHIPCAINLPWNSGVFEQEYNILPKDKPIMVLCRSGYRSGLAAAMLGQNGYTDIYSVAGGMSMWTGPQTTCKDFEDCEQNLIYFPHIASGEGWETDIAIINISSETSLSGIIKAYNATGEQVGDLHPVDLPPAGRTEMRIGTTFSNPELIRYLIFTASCDQVYAYLKFYNTPDQSYRVAIPAPKTINKKDIIVSHIAMSGGWWTGLNLLNTTNENRTLTLTFNTGKSKLLTIAAGAHLAVSFADLLEGWQLDKINSAIISNAEGIIGLEIFGNGKQLSGILLRDKTSKNLYYPHIADDQFWWTGLVAYNPGNSTGQLTIKPYAADGTLLSPPDPATPTRMVYLSPPAAATPIEIGAKERYIGATSELDLPEGTKWMAIESSVPVSGFELFGTTNNLKLAGYTSVGIDSATGVFPKYEHHNDWTGIALINTTSDSISITLTAYTDNGDKVDSKTLPLSGFEQIVKDPQVIFDNSIDTATYIAYKATAPVVAFQINSEGDMLDALPGR